MVQEGDRVRITGIMREDPQPMEIGAEGTVAYVNRGRDGEDIQYRVYWDNGRGLLLLPGDPFIVLGGGGAHRKPDPT